GARAPARSLPWQAAHAVSRMSRAAVDAASDWAPSGMAVTVASSAAHAAEIATEFRIPRPFHPACAVAIASIAAPAGHYDQGLCRISRHRRPALVLQSFQELEGVDHRSLANWPAGPCHLRQSEGVDLADGCVSAIFRVHGDPIENPRHIARLEVLSQPVEYQPRQMSLERVHLQEVRNSGDVKEVAGSLQSIGFVRERPSGQGASHRRYLRFHLA